MGMINLLLKGVPFLRSLYVGRMDVYQDSYELDIETGVNVPVLKKYLEDIPCRISLPSSEISRIDEYGEVRILKTDNKFSVILFTDPEHVILEGSYITVAQDGWIRHYRKSGISSVFPSHQEVALEEDKEWVGAG